MIRNEQKLNILVIGGTSFFGKQLVEDLLQEGHEITIASRGNRRPFTNVKYVIIDRDVSSSLQTLKDSSWDRVYDQICMNERHAEMMISLFKNVGHYIHISTGSVYDGHSTGHLEDELDMENYPLYEFDEVTLGHGAAYGENKRRAEAIFFQKLQFPFTAIRFCIVVGKDDTSKRLDYHIQKIKNTEEIYFPNQNARMSFITQEDASSFLRLVGDNKNYGAYNIMSGILSIGELVNIIEDKTNKTLIEAFAKNKNNSSPYGIEDDWCLNIDKAISIGYKPNSNFKRYFQNLIPR
ncbi:MAG: NAD-dependent epimerase/dehydratase family protein [Bacteriovoracaceae bacterium]|jgi:nucleoside-diphosphate-sugar epimerase|nr:NAD-dependent epimerase/dehydratase family protein [Bacteriovoracaceae bacterium]